MAPPRYSLVIPFFNEADNVGPLWTATLPVLAQLGAAWEAVLVDDGSTDGTGAHLDGLAAQHPELRVIHFAQNRGQAEALLAGLREARGEIILTMDGDGQNDPRDLPRLLETLRATEADLVCGWRRERHDTFVRRIMSRIGFVIGGIFLRDRVHDRGCQIRVMRREVVGALVPVRLMQSFVPAIAVAAGFRVVERETRHHPRLHGQSKYGVGNLWWRPGVEMLAVWWKLRARRRRRAP